MMNRHHESLELAIITAWEGEYFRRQKRLPKIEKVLGQLKKKLPQDYDVNQMRNDWQHLKTMFPEPK